MEDCNLSVGKGLVSIIMPTHNRASILNETIDSIIMKKEVLENMGKNAYKASVSNVEEKIYDEIVKIVKQK